MKKFLRTALVLPLVLFAVSCSESNDDGGDDKPVKLSPETKQEQQVYADDKQAPAPIKFTATAPWTATVAEVQTKAEAGSEVDWLTLSAYKGNPGDISLTMTLSPNYTGTDRKAEIRIACGGTIITVTVEQKGTTESGEKPEDPDKPKPNPIELSGETPTQQTVWADETQTPKNIAFKATGPWTATVAEVAVKAEAGSVDWLALSTYSGDAGEVSLTATLSPNYTGADRKAEIRIVCGDAAVVLTVEQKATKADGTLPEDPNKPEQSDLKNQIKRIEKYWYNEAGKLDPLDEYYEFEYDETGRVKTIKWFEYGDEVSDGTVEVNTTITYNASSILYESKQTEKDETSTSTSDWTASIVLENGRAVSGEIKDYYNKGTMDIYLSNYTFHYDEAGQLIKAVRREPVENGPERVYDYQLTWKDGNPIQVEEFEGQTKNFIDAATYGTIENNTNIDLNWLLLLDSQGWTFGTDDITDIFSIMGYNMGKRPKNMVETVTNTSEHAYLPSTYHYEFDDKSRINKITEDKSIEYRIFYAE